MSFHHRLPVEAGAREFAFVVLTYRCVMAEMSGAEEAYRTRVWDFLKTQASDGEAEALFAGAFGFVRALLASVERPLYWRRTFCAHLTDDERLVVSMLAAAQRFDTSALLGFAAELIGVDNLGDALGATQDWAASLTRRGIRLPRGVAADVRTPDRVLH